MEGTITTIQRMSVHDGAGIRSTLFLKGVRHALPLVSQPGDVERRRAAAADGRTVHRVRLVSGSVPLVGP